jgi:hypothetical protein
MDGNADSLANDFNQRFLSATDPMMEDALY